MSPRRNPVPLAGGNRAGLLQAEHTVDTRENLRTQARLRLADWRPLTRNSLRGFATIELPNGLTISDVSVHVSNGRAWASLPAKPQLNPDGTTRRSDDGKIIYTAFLKWGNRTLQDGFSAAVVQAVEAENGPLK
jgi:hypothetical protein